MKLGIGETFWKVSPLELCQCGDLSLLRRLFNDYGLDVASNEYRIIDEMQIHTTLVTCLPAFSGLATAASCSSPMTSSWSKVAPFSVTSMQGGSTDLDLGGASSFSEILMFAVRTEGAVEQVEPAVRDGMVVALRLVLAVFLLRRLGIQLGGAAGAGTSLSQLEMFDLRFLDGPGLSSSRVLRM